MRRFKLGDFTGQTLRSSRSATNGSATATAAPRRTISTAPIDLLEQAYSWADRLATHFAQTYRSGHIFNFLLGSVAVCLGLSAFMAPHLKFEFAALELVITFAIILNAHVGIAQRVASPVARLSPARRAAAADAQPEAARHCRARPAGNARPTRCRSAGSTGMRAASGARWAAPPASSTARPRRCLGDGDRRLEVSRRSRYHEHHAEQIEKLDHRLEYIGTVLFVATLVTSVVTLVGLAVGSTYVNQYGNWFTLVSAGFPALGTAVFGISFQGDFGGDALRSMATVVHACDRSKRAAQ